MQETAPLPGVPRTSYHQATQVGRTQYGQPQQQAPQQAPQGYQPQPQLPHQDQPTAQYRPAGEPSAYQASPYQAGPGAAPAKATPPPGGGRAGTRAAGGGRGSSRGVMFGAIGVGVAVVVVIGVVAFSGSPDKSGNAGKTGAASSSAPAALPPVASASTTPSVAPTTGIVAPVDAATLTLSGGAKTNTDHKNALSAGGTFVDGMTTPGATVTWTVDAPAKGSYFLWVHYANATGQDSGAMVTVNQKASSSRSIGLKDYGSKGSWDSWFSSYSGVSLQKGQNTIAITCTPPVACNFNLDQLALTPPTDSSSRPSTWK
ncbi:carbohydrate-binding protein [Streptacidiphilus sp. PAMC 29251]